MDKKDLINTQRVIKLLSYCKKLLKPEDIENNFIDEAINSLKRKIDMGDKHKSLYSKYQQKYRQLGILKED